MKNISKILSIIFLIISILLFCYIFYRSQILYSGTRADYYLKYYVIIFLFIIFSIISFFIPKRIKINITIVFASLLISLYFIEAYLNIKEKSIKFETYKKNTGKNFDKRTKFEVYKDLKKDDPDIVVTIYQGQFRNDNKSDYFLLSGLANRRTIYCNENGYYSIYKSDRYGFNNPDTEWDKEEIDYLLIGDSFAQGACVNEPDTISGNLKRLRTNKNGILSLGQGGSGPLTEYATLREYLPEKKVKRILWLYYENDLHNLRVELKNKFLIKYLNDSNFSQNLISRQEEIEEILLEELQKAILIQKNKSDRQFLTKVVKFVRLDLVRGLIFYKPTIASTKGFKNILKASNDFAKKNNSKLYFVYLPDYVRYIDRYEQGNLYNYRKVIQIVKDLNIPIIDMNEELFYKHKDPLSLFPFRQSAHYNEKGYQLVTETIVNKIKELEK